MNDMQNARRPARPDCQVLVVGAGPTGLVLAADLLARGVAARIIDKGGGAALGLTARHAAGARGEPRPRRRGAPGSKRCAACWPPMLRQAPPTDPDSTAHGEQHGRDHPTDITN